MTPLERLRQIGIALFNPRRAVAEGLYDGRVLSSVWLNLIITGWLYIQVFFLKETRKLMLENPFVFVIILLAPFFVAIFNNWISPRILIRRLQPKDAVLKQLTKRERREMQKRPQATLPFCRQVVLFLSLICMVLSLPYTIWNSFNSPSGWTSYITTVIWIAIGGVWIYAILYPQYIGARRTAINKTIVFIGLTGLLMFVIAFIIMLVILVVIAVIGAFGTYSGASGF